MINLYIDFDGVILNTIEVSYQMMEELKIDRTLSEQVTKFYEDLNWKEFLLNCEPINDSICAIQNVIDSKKFNVNILSHVVSLNEAIEKINYIRKYFKDITFIPVPRKISKTKMVHTENAILIDDYTGNLREWEKEKGIGVRFSTKLNGKGYAVIDRLDKIIDMVSTNVSVLNE